MQRCLSRVLSRRSSFNWIQDFKNRKQTISSVIFSLTTHFLDGEILVRGHRWWNRRCNMRRECEFNAEIRPMSFVDIVIDCHV
jgi:hypothetical protein